MNKDDAAPRARGGWHRGLMRASAVAVATVLLCWPALWNGYPLLYADSLGYLTGGPAVISKLVGRSVPYWMYASERSEIYAMGIYLLHGGLSLWLIAVAQSALTAWLLWLVVRSLSPRPVRTYLLLMAGLSALTGVAWYTSFIMPDSLGGVLYLSLYLLLFWPKALGRGEKAALVAAACWASASHSTHLVVAACVVTVFALLWLVRWAGMKGRGAGLLQLAAILLVSAGAQMALHARLYGRATLSSSEAPPFLMARLIGDGPARLYLQKNCARLTWTICLHAHDLPERESDFLWPAAGIWRSSTKAQQQELRQEQMPLLWATLRSYPREQAARSWSNFRQELTSEGPWNFWNIAELTPVRLNAILPGLSAVYPRTKQAHSAMPQVLFRSLQTRVLEVCALAVAVLLPWAWYRRQWQLLGLAATVLVVFPMNALLCGVVSCIDPRLQDRIAWMLALLAGLLLAAWLQRDVSAEGPYSNELEAPATHRLAA